MKVNSSAKCDHPPYGHCDFDRCLPAKVHVRHSPLKSKNPYEISYGYCDFNMKEDVNPYRISYRYCDFNMKEDVKEHVQHSSFV